MTDIKRALILLPLLVGACTTSTTTPAITSTPNYRETQISYRETQTTKYTKTTTETVVSPNGLIKLTYSCVQFLGDMPRCSTKFPNGNSIGKPLEEDWSPDGKFAIICIGATHDSPCRWLEVWDMVIGEERDEIHNSWYCYDWSPHDDHLLAYMYESPYIGTHKYNLVILNPATGKKSHPEIYPTWFYPRGYFDPLACWKPLDEIVPDVTAMPVSTEIPTGHVVPTPHRKPTASPLFSTPTPMPQPTTYP
jgi:hypothetical protein